MPPPFEGAEEPLIVVLTIGGEIFLQDVQDVAIKVNSLAPRLQGITRENLQARIYIRADQSLPHGHIMEVMSVIGGAGYQRMALISEPFQGKDSRDLKK